MSDYAASMMDKLQFNLSFVVGAGASIALKDIQKQVDAVEKKLEGLNGKAKEFNEKLESAKKKFGDLSETGSQMSDIGKSMLDSLKDPIEAATKFEQQVTRFKEFGLGDAMQEQAIKYVKGMDDIGLSMQEKMSTFNDAQATFGSKNMADTGMMAHMMAQARTAAASMGQQDQSKDFAQFAKDNSGDDLNRAKQLMDFGFKATETGKVKLDQLNSFMASSGSSAKKISTEALGGLLPILDSMGAEKAGSSLNSALAHAKGTGPMTKSASASFEKNLKQLGLGDGKTGLAHADEFAKDPAAAYEKYVLPMYKKAGLKQGDYKAENSKIFGAEGGKIFTEISQKLDSMKAAKTRMGQALGIEGAAKAAEESPDEKNAKYAASLDKLKTVIGESLLPATMKLVSTLTTLFNWFSKHETILKILTGLFAGLGLALAIAGVVIALIVGFGVLAIVLGTLAAPILVGVAVLILLGTLLWAFWDTLCEWLSKVGKFFKHIFGGGDDPAKGGANTATSSLPATVAPPKSATTSAAVGNVILDGKKVGAVLDSRSAKQANNIFSQSGSMFNPGMSLPFAGAGAFGGGS